ncbi:AraC family transcriptional regulator [Pokkaliibacter sp. MBI-7]|uniref:AraC family transcriptional regulator n=1 Tax=Pokkaliibacter sp. MBI-7 TaxID=3040600 RepID=UPI002447BA93|nr:AraC family transcriptional regulator [Pokkaliibacter sp. MBI-7]MDH2432365.1 AraC family transcriptional regulator [Pokkaliibacter sp. MBI-7]
MSQHQLRMLPSLLADTQAMVIDSNRHYPRHSHDQYGIGLIHRGAQRSASGCGRVEAGPGELIMVNPGEVHDGVPLAEEGRQWSMLYFEPSLLHELASELELPFSAELSLVRPVAQDQRLRQQFVQLFQRVTSVRQAHQAQVDVAARLAAEESAVSTLVYLLAHHSQARPLMPASATVEQVRQRLADEPLQAPSLHELAAMVGVSRFNLIRSFNKALGLSPHAYLLQQRLHLARRLLLSGHKPVDAALAAGFADQSHMTRLFRRQYGITPGLYGQIGSQS